MKSLSIFCISIFFLFIITSCSKSYDVRFTNYNTEAFDTVVIGNDKIIFTAIEKETTTAYENISKGIYTIKCISKTKKVYTSTLSIPKEDGGKRTIQIDGLNAISVFEE